MMMKIGRLAVVVFAVGLDLAEFADLGSAIPAWPMHYSKLVVVGCWKELGILCELSLVFDMEACP